MAVNAGLDMIMNPYDTHIADTIISLVHSGEIKLDRINDAVRRILRVKVQFGSFPTTL